MGRYTIKELALTNITTHSNTRLTEIPRRGSLAIIGPNGAGKSSIIESIYFALTLSPLGTRNTRDLVSWGREQGKITLVLESDDGDEIKSIVYIKARDRRAKEAYLFRQGKTIATGVDSYKREMAKLLGIRSVRDYDDLLRLSAIIPQGGLQEIAREMSKPSKFRELVEKSIGLPDYKRAVEKLEQATLEVDGYTFNIPRISSVHPAMIASRSKNYKRLVEKIADTRENLEKIRKEIKNSINLKEKLEDETKRLQALADRLKNEVEELSKKQQTIASRLESVKQKIKLLGRKKDEYENAKRELEEARKALQLLPRVEEVAGLHDEFTRIHELRNTIMKLEYNKKELESILENLKTIEENKSYYEEYEGLAEEYDKLENQRLQLASEKSSLEKEVENLNKQREAINSIMDQLSLLLNLKRTGSIEEDYEWINAKLKELERDRDEARRKLEELNREESSIASKIEEAKKALDAIISATQPKCPVCGRHLDENSKREIINRLEESIVNYSNKLKNLKNERLRIEQTLSIIEDQLDRAKALLNKLSLLKESLNTRDLEEKKRKLADIERRYNEVEKRIKEVGARLLELEEAVRAYHSALDNLEKLGLDPSQKVEIEARYRQLTGELEELRAEHDSRIRRILEITGKKRLEDALVEVERARKLLVELKVKARRAGELEEKIRELESELVELEEAESLLSNLEEEYMEIERLLSERSEELERVREEKENTARELAKIEATIEHLEEKEGELKKELEVLSKAKSKMITAIMAGVIIKDTQEKLLETTRQELESAMSEILEKFGLAYREVEIDNTQEGFEVYVKTIDDKGRIRKAQVSNLSGGEQTALALSYVLALQRVLAIKLGFLILDEPTSNLDSERRSTLIDLISNLANYDLAGQLIIVTHHEEVIDSVDKTCRIERSGGGVSKVDC